MSKGKGSLQPPVDVAGYRDLDTFTVEAQGHHFTFLAAGEKRLDRLIELIDNAQSSLQLFYYMFDGDQTGVRVQAALAEAARRGVDVLLMIDAFGSDAPKSFFDPLVQAGGRFSLFSPRWNVRYLIRNHQKFVIVDGQKVLTGGINISDHYFAPPEANGWCDLGVLIEGPLVDRFTSWFADLDRWASNPKAQFRHVRQLVRDWDAGSGPVQLLLGGPTRITSAWAQSVKKDLARGSRLDMAMAYFSPPLSMRRLIRGIARRGKARLVMAGKSDNGATIGAARALYGPLLRGGAEICEFQPCKLHMKLLVVDDVTYFGSANLDMRSVRLNLELMVRVEDAALAEKMREVIAHLAEFSEPVTRAEHRRRSTLFNQMRWRLGWFLVSVLDYTVTRRLNLGM